MSEHKLEWIWFVLFRSGPLNMAEPGLLQSGSWSWVSPHHHRRSLLVPDEGWVNPNPNPEPGPDVSLLTLWSRSAPQWIKQKPVWLQFNLFRQLDQISSVVKACETATQWCVVFRFMSISDLMKTIMFPCRLKRSSRAETLTSSSTMCLHAVRNQMTHLHTKHQCH